MRHLIVAMMLLVLVVAAGTIGYVLIEDWPPLDAFYMTIISITTTGFAEVRPLSPPGRILTVLLIIAGVSTLAYVGGRAVQDLIESKIFRRRKVSKKVEQLENHYIICGYGRLGRPICKELAASNSPFVVVEKSEERVEQLAALGYLFIHGDATQDDILLKAGIQRARGLVGVLATDADNVYVTLTARELNHQIFIVTRAIDDQAEKKLRRAGAHRIVKPYEIGAHRMAHLLVRPGVVDFIDIVARKNGMALGLEEIVVSEKSPLVNKTLMESPIRKQLNIIIVAIYRNNNYIYNPTSASTIHAGDRLIAIGQWDDLQKLNLLCGQERNMQKVV